jgi:NAD(P)-dependent dehydrogenase (short-subunit alcohol dehydrogenase family)
MSVGLCARTEPVPPPGATAVTAALDVSDAGSVEAFADRVVAELGPIDLWINNAGVLEPMGPQRDHDPAAVERALLVNVGGVANGTRAFTRRVAAGPDRPRTLVNVSSGAATSVYAGWSIYGATKAAVDHFTRIVAVEEPGVRCVAVAPGVVDTDMQAMIRTHDAADFPAIDRFHELHRTGSWNSPGWVADHVLALHLGLLTAEAVVYRVPDEPRRG